MGNGVFVIKVILPGLNFPSEKTKIHLKRLKSICLELFQKCFFIINDFGILEEAHNYLIQEEGVLVKAVIGPPWGD